MPTENQSPPLLATPLQPGVIVEVTQAAPSPPVQPVIVAPPVVPSPPPVVIPSPQPAPVSEQSGSELQREILELQRKQGEILSNISQTFQKLMEPEAPPL